MGDDDQDDNHDQDGAAKSENEEDGNEDDEEDAAHDDEEEEVENVEVEDRSTPLTQPCGTLTFKNFRSILLRNIGVLITCVYYSLFSYIICYYSEYIYCINYVYLLYSLFFFLL
jgi:hypothetical protein